MIACKECGHQISDQAVGCPHCGAPVASKPKGHPLRRGLYSALITLAVLWLIGTTVWIVRTFGTSSEPATAGPWDQTSQQASLVRPAPSVNEPVAAQPQPSESPAAPAARVVYQTTAEQLYQDYSANGVATQSRIGNSRIRITGSIAEIDEDVLGRPVIALAAGQASSAQMTLTADQTAAAAQLVKGETVAIECDRMQRILTSPHGSACALVLIDAGSRPAPAEVAVNEEAPAASHVPAASRARSATATAAPHVARRRRAVAPPAIPVPAEGSVEVSEPPPDAPAPVTEQTPAAVAALTPDAAQTVPLPAAAATAPLEAHPSATPASGEAPLPRLTLASAQTSPPTSSGAGISTAPATAAAMPAAAAVATPPSQPSPVTSSAVASDDLATVRASDPQAADHIASYCSSTTALAVDRAASQDECRRDEVAAWTRLVQHNEFPALDDATRRKCSEAPFPDSYVAKELCARYELHLD